MSDTDPQAHPLLPDGAARSTSQPPAESDSSPSLPMIVAVPLGCVVAASAILFFLFCWRKFVHSRWQIRPRDVRPAGSRGRGRNVLPAMKGTTEVFQAPPNGTAIPECSLCLQPYRDGELLRRLPCRHTFHASCVDRWLLRSAGSARCPLCNSCPFTPARAVTSV